MHIYTKGGPTAAWFFAIKVRFICNIVYMSLYHNWGMLRRKTQLTQGERVPIGRPPKMRPICLQDGLGSGQQNSVAAVHNVAKAKRMPWLPRRVNRIRYSSLFTFPSQERLPGLWRRRDNCKVQADSPKLEDSPLAIFHTYSMKAAFSLRSKLGSPAQPIMQWRWALLPEAACRMWQRRQLD